MTAHDRTAHWVQKHSGEIVFYSPSFPPSELDDYISVPPSPAESSRSIPPRMILRYDDGRPDIPIPHADHSYGRHGARTYDTVDPRARYDARGRGGQHGSSHGKPPVVESRTRRAPDRVLLNAPEDIRVLPAAIPHAPPRSRSVPRSYDPAVGPMPQQIHPLPPSGSYAPISHAYQPQPSSRHSRRESHAYYHGYHPPQVAPNSVIYSHSAPPVLMGHGHPTAALHTGAQEYRRGTSGTRMGIERSTSSRTRSVSLSGRRPAAKPLVVDRSETSSASDSEPDETYYASRSRRKAPTSQTPSTSKSVTTATSSGRSPVTPSSAIHGKRPFFQRLFHFAGKLSHAGASRASSVVDAGDLHRRHSISESRR